MSHLKLPSHQSDALSGNTLSGNTSPDESVSLAYSPREELLNTLTHALGLLLSVAGLIFLLAEIINPAQSDSLSAFNLPVFKLLSVTIFGLSLIALYGASTCYHAARCPEKKRTFKMWDHCAIYLLIAGSYTPFLLVSMRDTVGWQFFVIIWSIALAGILLKLKFGHRFKLLRVATYLVMGWLVVITFDELKAALPASGLNLLIAGGLVYTLGVVFYLNRRLPFSHAIWHLFVLGGSACHFFSIYYSVVSYSSTQV
jgi:hemolysin III